MIIDNLLKNCKVKVWPGIYSVVKARYIPQHYVAVIRDFNETTVITEPNNIPSDCVIQEEPDWKILTFELELPFELVGFLSVVTKHLAEAAIPVFVLSSFSTDHIMVKLVKLEETLGVLHKIGCKTDM